MVRALMQYVYHQLQSERISRITSDEKEYLMTIQDFLIEAKTVVSSCLAACSMGDIIVEKSEVVKTNDTRQYGLNLREEGSACGRTVYLEDLYERCRSGEDLDSVLGEVLERCMSGLSFEGPDLDLMRDIHFDRIRNRLLVRTLSFHNNLSYMSDKPYIDTGCGLALVASINSERSIMSEWRATVTDSMLKEIGCDGETLLTEALRNTIELEPPRLSRLSEVAHAMMDEDVVIVNYLDGDYHEDSSPEDIYVLSNESLYQGASAMFYPGVMQQIAEVVGGGYTAIPSSVHEMMIVPDEIGAEQEYLRSVLYTGNRRIEDKADILSDDLYHYDPEDMKLRLTWRA